MTVAYSESLNKLISAANGIEAFLSDSLCERRLAVLERKKEAHGIRTRA